MKRLAILLASGAALALYVSANSSLAGDGRPAEDVEIVSDTYQTENPAPGTETFGKVQFILKGDPLVPPRDYAESLEIPRAELYSPDESGRIYDIAYGGIENGKLQFDVRGYAVGDLKYPANSERSAFAVDQKVVELRDFTIEIDAVEAGSLTYRVRLKEGAT